MAVKPKEHYNRGFHPTATCGTFGAAVSAAKLLGLLAGAVWERNKVETVQGAVQRLEHENSLRNFAAAL